MRLKSYMNTNKPYLADGGLETYMIFEKGFDLPCFSSHVLVETEEGRNALEEYFDKFAIIARDSGRGFFLDTASWRLNSGWAPKLGLDEDDLIKANRSSTQFARKYRDVRELDDLPMVLNGSVGPSGDGYTIEAKLTPAEAEGIHRTQISTFAREGVDLVSAITMTHTGEAIGAVNAAREADVPISISFTVETDGRLPSGQPLNEAIEEVDSETGNATLYFMINCAHPDHFGHVLEADTEWMKRIGGLRANASRLSHEELDACEELDPGNPEELGDQYARLQKMFPNLVVVGGCCGTDHRHIGCISRKAA